MKQRVICVILMLFTAYLSAYTQKSDLVIAHILTPEVGDDSNTISVVVKNSGDHFYNGCFKIRVSDADITFYEAKKLAKKNMIYINASRYAKNFFGKTFVKPEITHEYLSNEVCELSPEQSKMIKINIGKWWPYDPNCDIKVEIIPSDIPEDFSKKEAAEYYEDSSGDDLKNNSGYFFYGG